jgi:hypothetical protein
MNRWRVLFNDYRAVEAERLERERQAVEAEATRHGLAVDRTELECG